jgi:cystathionine beta-synthase
MPITLEKPVRTMEYLEDIFGAVGNTPLVRLKQVAKGVRPKVLAKVEYLNPGGSVKDRMAIYMIEDAVRRGLLKPGGTIVENTSGNTGVGLAMYAAAKGYRALFTIPDKMSNEKINLLKAFGAEVVVCPTAVPPDSPESYYEVAKRKAGELPNAFYVNQYHNPMNPEAHYHTTGPEIWEQTAGRIDCFVAGAGTGGTVSGAGRYLKEMNSQVRVVAVDPVGSVYYDYFKSRTLSEPHPYLVEGIGEDMLCQAMDMSVIDEIVQVTDRESFIMARRLAREEGIFAGGSSGAAVVGALRVAEKMQRDQVLVVLLPDSGDRYLSKIFNDDWMREKGFL